jgi:hypothetical protein
MGRGTLSICLRTLCITRMVKMPRRSTLVEFPTPKKHQFNIVT